MVTKLVLLDFDGVLNTNAYRNATASMFPGVRTFSSAIGRALIDPERVARIQRICDATGAGVLLVTGWRQWTEWTELAEILKDRGLTATVVGAVGGIKMSGELRASASLEWLSKHREVTRFVVIDDDTHHWYPPKKWEGSLVTPTDGIEDNHVAEAIAILNQE
jgi:hypothetical protein